MAEFQGGMKPLLSSLSSSIHSWCLVYLLQAVHQLSLFPARVLWLEYSYEFSHGGEDPGVLSEAHIPAGSVEC